jgi:hypothetical protein
MQKSCRLQVDMPRRPDLAAGSLDERIAGSSTVNEDRPASIVTEPAARYHHIPIPLHSSSQERPPMDEFNPYAPPKAEVILDPFALAESGVWRDGPLLVMTKDAELPDRCLKCNLPTGGWKLRRKLSWHPYYWYFLILFHIIIYIIVALIVRQKATVMIPLCEAHRRRRSRAIAVGWLLGLGGIAAFVLGASFQDYAPAGILGGLLLILTGLIFGIAGSQVAVPKKIDERFVWIKKVHPAFLAELPVYTY